jgi:DNA-binding NarL/FixJ family response regulator
LSDAGVADIVEVDSIATLAAHGGDGGFDAIVMRIGASHVRVIDAFRAARERFPHASIVGLWPGDQGREDRRALRAGVDGLLREDQIESALVPTLRAVCSGLVCFPRPATAHGQCETLSRREKQVLGMLVMGFTNAEIGRRLFLAESTVKSHLSSAYTKLGVRSRKDAAAVILDPDGGLGTRILALSGP